MRICFRLTILLTIAMLVGVTGALAQSDDFEVRVEVVDSCDISADDLDFVSYDPNSLLPTLGTTTITATCTLLTPFEIGIDEGSVGSSVSDRKMDDDATGAETLDYTLSCAGAGVPACAVNWGNTPGSDTFISVGTGLPIPVVVAGTIPAGQQVTPGGYRDNPVTATIFF